MVDTGKVIETIAFFHSEKEHPIRMMVLGDGYLKYDVYGTKKWAIGFLFDKCELSTYYVSSCKLIDYPKDGDELVVTLKSSVPESPSDRMGAVERALKKGTEF